MQTVQNDEVLHVAQPVEQAVAHDDWVPVNKYPELHDVQ